MPLGGSQSSVLLFSMWPATTAILHVFEAIHEISLPSPDCTVSVMLILIMNPQLPGDTVPCVQEALKWLLINENDAHLHIQF